MTTTAAPGIPGHTASAPPDGDLTARFITTIAGIVIGLTFTFGFGTVLHVALRLGVPAPIAPLVAPAVDLSVVGLLVGTRYLAVHGARRSRYVLHVVC